jgi:GH24 family phage-related lysozyme (muramidase)
MYQSVKDNFVRFTSVFEGVVPHMYLDVKQLVTIGIGDLIDPIGTAIVLPFAHVDGTPATKGEISDEWMHVKGTGAVGARLGHLYTARFCTLHLTDEGIAEVVGQREDTDERFTKGRFPDWDTWPADAQLATLSMDWAMGPGFNFPAFQACALKRDWSGCADNCRINTAGNPGVVPRNAANVKLFTLAANAEKLGDDLSVLRYYETAP